MSWLKDLWDILNGRKLKSSASEQLLMQQLYRGMLEDQQKRFDTTIGEIKEHRKRHKDNGIELDAWEKREHELHQQAIRLINENKDLREALIFKNIEILEFKKVIIRLHNQLNKAP